MLLSDRVAAIKQLEDSVLNSSIELQTISTVETRQQNIDWKMLRLDQLDHELSGNKLFKLLPYLKQAAVHNNTTLISFGGRYSNHLHALAHACKRFGFSMHAIVRAYPEQEITPTLQDLYDLGVSVEFATRQEYRLRYDKDYQQRILDRFPQAMIINEGGNSELGRSGMKLLAKLIEQALCYKADYVVLPTGTGCCFAGLLKYLPEHVVSTVVAVPALNNTAEIDSIVAQSQRQSMVLDGFQFGGFAKSSVELKEFSQSFAREQKIPLDPVYTAKMSFALNQLIIEQVFAAGSKIVSLHTGGLQGAR